MLEVFDRLDFEKACNKQKGLIKLLDNYINDQNRLLVPQKIFLMMRYFKVEDRKNISMIGEIGEYAALRAKLLKKRVFKFRNISNFTIINMENINFLLDVQNKLKLNIQNKAQYRTLRSAFLLMSLTDVKWFVRLLCRKIKITKSMLEVIEKCKSIE